MSNVRVLDTLKATCNDSVKLSLEDALQTALEEGADGLALAMVLNDGRVVSGFVDGNRYFEVLGALTDLQLEMHRNAKQGGL